MKRIDIVLPVYNPPRDWEKIVSQRFEALRARLSQVQFNLILVNDGSSAPDVEKTMNQLKEEIDNLQWISYPVNQGKGYALRKGVEIATGDYIVYTDVDWPYLEKSMVELIENLWDGADVAIGVRDKTYYQQLPGLRRKISIWLRKLNSRLLALSVPDTQAGLKGFNARVKPLFLSTTINRYLFDLEFIHLLARHKTLRVIAVPVQLREGILFSKMNRKILWQEGWNFIKILAGVNAARK